MANPFPSGDDLPTNRFGGQDVVYDRFDSFKPLEPDRTYKGALNFMRLTNPRPGLNGAGAGGGEDRKKDKKNKFTSRFKFTTDLSDIANEMFQRGGYNLSSTDINASNALVEKIPAWLCTEYIDYLLDGPAIWEKVVYDELRDLVPRVYWLDNFNMVLEAYDVGGAADGVLTPIVVNIERMRCRIVEEAFETGPHDEVRWKFDNRWFEPHSVGEKFNVSALSKVYSAYLVYITNLDFAAAVSMILAELTNFKKALVKAVNAHVEDQYPYVDTDQLFLLAVRYRHHVDALTEPLSLVLGQWFKMDYFRSGPCMIKHHEMSQTILRDIWRAMGNVVARSHARASPVKIMYDEAMDWARQKASSNKLLLRHDPQAIKDEPGEEDPELANIVPVKGDGTVRVNEDEDMPPVSASAPFVASVAGQASDAEMGDGTGPSPYY